MNTARTDDELGADMWRQIFSDVVHRGPQWNAAPTCGGSLSAIVQRGPLLALQMGRFSLPKGHPWPKFGEIQEFKKIQKSVAIELLHAVDGNPRV